MHRLLITLSATWIVFVTPSQVSASIIAKSSPFVRVSQSSSDHCRRCSKAIRSWQDELDCPERIHAMNSATTYSDFDSALRTIGRSPPWLVLANSGVPFASPHHFSTGRSVDWIDPVPSREYAGQESIFEQGVKLYSKAKHDRPSPTINRGSDIFRSRSLADSETRPSPRTGDRRNLSVAPTLSMESNEGASATAFGNSRLPKFEPLDSRLTDPTTSKSASRSTSGKSLLTLFSIAVVVIASLFYGLSGIHWIPPDHCVRISSLFGSTRSVEGPSVSIAFWPFAMVSKVDTRFKRTTIDRLQPVTRDGYQVTLSVNTCYQIVDPKLALQMRCGADAAVHQIIEPVINMLVGSMNVEHLITNQRDLCKRLQREADKQLALSGISLRSFAISNFVRCRAKFIKTQALGDQVALRHHIADTERGFDFNDQCVERGNQSVKIV